MNKKVTFVQWCPTGFKVGLNDEPPAVLEFVQCDDESPFKRDIRIKQFHQYPVNELIKNMT